MTGEASAFNIDAIEDSELFLHNRAAIPGIDLGSSANGSLFRNFFQDSLVTKEFRLMSTITQNAQDRHVQVCELSPQIIKQIPQNLIAFSFGNAPETLTRIKKNLTKSK